MYLLVRPLLLLARVIIFARARNLFRRFFRPVKDKPGNHKVVKGLNGDEKVLHSVMSGVGALRASSLNKVSI